MAIVTMILGTLASGFFKIIPGLAQKYLDHKQNQAVQGTQRQGIWAGALVSAAHADVENRRIAAAERSGNRILMGLYIMTLAGPVFYWFMFWMDTIFAGQVWSLWGWEIMNWATWDLPRAPDRLEEYGKEVIANGLFGTAAIYGVTKAAKILQATGLLNGK